jgi:hypothetical protein
VHCNMAFFSGSLWDRFAFHNSHANSSNGNSTSPILQWKLDSLWDDWMGFFYAINFQNDAKWILPILTLIMIIAAIAVISRHNWSIQFAILSVISLCVFSMEYVNSLAAANWRTFSSQNYFDLKGVFMGTLFALPLMLVAAFILVSFPFDTFEH